MNQLMCSLEGSRTGRLRRIRPRTWQDEYGDDLNQRSNFRLGCEVRCDVQSLIILGDSDHKDEASDALEAMDPLLPFRTLPADLCSERTKYES